MVSATTAWDNPNNGETLILYVYQALWFGLSLLKTLLSTSQIRSNGISLCDDPFDKHRTLGLICFDRECHEEIHIDFSLEGVFVGFISHVPTDNELVNCRIIHLTSDHSWIPKYFNIATQDSLSTDLKQCICN